MPRRAKSSRNRPPHRGLSWRGLAFGTKLTIIGIIVPTLLALAGIGIAIAAFHQDRQIAEASLSAQLESNRLASEALAVAKASLPDKTSEPVIVLNIPLKRR